MTIEEIIKEKRKKYCKSLARRGAYNLRIFGSVAMGRMPDRIVTWICWWICSPEKASWTWAGFLWICRIFWAAGWMW